MKLEQLNADIKNGVISPLYMFTGEELGVMDLYLDQIKKVTGGDYVGADSVKEILPKFQNSGFIDLPQYFIIRDDSEFAKNGDVGKLTELISATGGNVILIYNNVKKTTNFWKKNTDIFVEFERLEVQQLLKTVMRKIPNKKVATQLIDVCNNDLSRINLEINKAEHYAAINDIDIDESVKSLLDQGLIYKSAEDITKELAHALMQRNGAKVFHLLKKYKQFGDTPLKATAFFYNGFRSLLALQLNSGTRNIEEHTGVAFWKVKDVTEYVGKYTDAELIASVKRIQFVDTGVKRGLIDQNIALDYLTLSILGGLR